MAESVTPPGDSLHQSLAALQVRFQTLTGLEAVALPVPDENADLAKLYPVPIHPACRDSEDSPACRVSWRETLKAVQARSGTYWRLCECGRYAAVASIIRDQHLAGIAKVVAPKSIGQQAFERHARLLDLLAGYAAFDGIMGGTDGDLDNRRSGSVRTQSRDPAGIVPENTHPLVRRALEIVEAGLSDTSLSVAEVSARLDVNASYLAHLFAQVTGHRMSHYIAERRVARAKELLEAEHLSIKQIAFQCGFKSSSWFGQVFRRHAGLTPMMYRRGETRRIVGARPGRESRSPENR